MEITYIENYRGKRYYTVDVDKDDYLNWLDGEEPSEESLCDYIEVQGLLDEEDYLSETTESRFLEGYSKFFSSL